MTAAAGFALGPTSRPGAAQRLARHAVASLYLELMLFPKPGLVSRHDAGAHGDMDASTFMRSLFSLRGFFAEIAQAGARGARFEALRDLGLRAEARMSRATCGVNTHRGAIFTLGLIAAAAGACEAAGISCGDAALLAALEPWQGSLAAMLVDATPVSHGRVVASRYGAGGARGEALQGFPGVFRCALPALRHALRAGAAFDRACLHALYALVSSIADTNLLFRGGRDGLEHAQGRARAFLAAGSVFAPGWEARAHAIHADFCARKLSPGGCADLLAATIFVHRLQAPE